MYHDHTPQDLRNKYYYDFDTDTLRHRAGLYKDKQVGYKDDIGYLKTSLTDKGGKVRNAMVSRIVWSMFNDEAPPSDLLVVHEDDDKSNINPDNLKLVTQKQNLEDPTKRKPKRQLAYIPTENHGVKVCRKTGIYVATGGGQILLESFSEDEAKYARWEWEAENVGK